MCHARGDHLALARRVSFNASISPGVFSGELEVDHHGLFEPSIKRYPMRLENRSLVALLGEEPHTPIDDALKATFGLACSDCRS